MHLIPVIDLMGEQAVHAHKGDRANYRPVDSPLVHDSDPVAVAQAYRSIHPFTTFYVADLDAIQGGAPNLSSLARLRAALPDAQFWIDSGLTGAAHCRAWLADGFGTAILGSETQTDPDVLSALAPEIAARTVILSLDFRGEAFLGPPVLLAASEAWPKEVIVLTLARVGAGAGPDFERLAMARDRRPDCAVYAAGGVRGAADLTHLKRSGIAGALIASALHDGSLTPADIAGLAAG